MPGERGSPPLTEPAGGGRDWLETLLRDRPITASRWGLDRIRALLAELGHPERRLAALHIAGTNGKGSTATLAAAVLTARGRRTALYTSPHLRDVRERFRLDGAPIDEALLQQAAREVADCDAARPATYFEVTTALALTCFARARATHAVLEAGLGGRLDATNVALPIATAITSIGYDHAELLGDTLEKIAGEKAGIIKPGIPVVLGRLDPGPLEVVLERAASSNAPVARLGSEARVEEIDVGLDGTRFRYTSALHPEGLALGTGLVGAHQAENAGVALLLLEAAGEPPDEDSARAGLAAAQIEGRFERWQEGPATWIFDIAHNREGVRALRETLRATGPPRPWIALVAILADKPWREMIEALRLDMDGIILTVAPSSPPARRWDPRAAVAALGPEGAPVSVEEDLAAAVEAARQRAGAGTVLVTGSAHTVGDARTALGGGAPIGIRGRDGG